MTPAAHRRSAPRAVRDLATLDVVAACTCGTAYRDNDRATAEAALAAHLAAEATPAVDETPAVSDEQWDQFLRGLHPDERTP